MDDPFFISLCEAPDCLALAQFVRNAKHSVEEHYFETALQEQKENKRIVFVARWKEQLAGYVHLNFYPQYMPFLRFGIPEVQDLFVSPDFRCQGVGSALLLKCESEVRRRNLSNIGIGVGVLGQFGAAQRLYNSMGYCPDGNGVVFDRIPVQAGDIRPVDDRLCLMLVKSL